MGTPNASHARDIDNVQFGFGNVLIVEFTETFKRGVLVDEFEHKFTGSIS